MFEEGRLQTHFSLFFDYVSLARSIWSYFRTSPSSIYLLLFYQGAELRFGMMDGTSANDVGFSNTAEELPESTVEINVKTLDAQTYTLRVNKYMPVPDLKEQIASMTGILSGQQRLICQGKILKDDQLLSAYHVEDGHTLHLVVRQPPSNAIASSVRVDDEPTHSGSSAVLTPTHNSLGQNVLFGTVNLADSGNAGTSDLNQFFSSLLGSLGLNSTGDGNHIISERTSGAGISAQAETSQGAVRHDSSHPQTIFGYQNAHHPMVIPDSLTTMDQFLNHMRHQFDVRGQFFTQVNSGFITQVSSGCYLSDHLPGGGQNGSSSLNSSQEQSGLPTPERLAGFLLSTRQVLMEEVGGSLYDLAKQLEEQGNVSDPLARTMIQSEAVRFGGLFQNFGSLLLELGRTVMTLRLGQTPSEAVVNAGPAIFVTSSTATPLMVQAGTSFGEVPLGHQQHVNPAPGILSGNINIRIHRGPSAAAPAANANDHPSENQTSRATNVARVPAETLVQQQVLGALADSGRRVVPLRTVVAMPAGIAHPQPDSSGSMGLLYPLFARFHQRIPRTWNDATISQEVTENRGPSGPSTSSAQNAATPVLNTSGEEPEGQEVGDGVFFSNLVRQLMPFISENGSESGPSSSSGRVRPERDPSDLPDERDSKRQKTD